MKTKNEFTFPGMFKISVETNSSVGDFVADRREFNTQYQLDKYLKKLGKEMLVKGFSSCIISPEQIQ